MNAVVGLFEHSTGDVVAVRFRSTDDANRWADANPEVELISVRPLCGRSEVLKDARDQPIGE